MTRRRRRDPEPAPDNERLLWSDAQKVLADAPAGEIVYEAPELRKRARAPKAAPKSLGLPFGVRDTADGHKVCWSCGHDLDDAGIVRAGPGDTRCGGCGAKLPFSE